MSLDADDDEDMADREITDSQLDRDATELLATYPNNDRLHDGLATGPEEHPTIQQPAIPQPAQEPAVHPEVKDDTTGKCDSSHGDSTGDEDFDDEEDASADQNPADVAGLMAAGGMLITRYSSFNDSQVDDDGDYEEALIRDEFVKLKSSTWVQRKLDKNTKELEDLVKQHEKSKRELIKPVKELIELNPEKTRALTLMSGLLHDACTDGDLRDAIITSANVLKSQVKIVDEIQKKMKTIQVGGVCLEEKKAEEARKRGQSSSTMSAAAALVASSSSKKQRKSK